MKELVLIDSTLFISDDRKGVTKQTKTYELNGEKFQIRYENSNGFPMGFNSKKCLAQYSKEKGQWNNLEDIGVLDMSMKTPSYFDMQVSKKHCEEFFNKMEQRLAKVYS